jgi:hypothetical protein
MSRPNGGVGKVGSPDELELVLLVLFFPKLRG